MVSWYVFSTLVISINLQEGVDPVGFPTESNKMKSHKLPCLVKYVQKG